MEINFICNECEGVFDCDVGTIVIDKKNRQPQYGNEIHCPTCGMRTKDQLSLTVQGQAQLSSATSELNPEERSIFNDEELFGYNDPGICKGCDSLHDINDLGLCGECSGKLDRDFIRQRDWAYSSLALGVSQSKREELRRDIIDQYGEEFELIEQK
ncbi:hypothetical protein ACFL6N_03510 [Thermodesulfobacteriota bacterium]